MYPRKPEPIIITESTEIAPKVFAPIDLDYLNLPYEPVLAENIEDNKPLCFHTWIEMLENRWGNIPYPNFKDADDVLEARCFLPLCPRACLTTVSEDYSSFSWSNVTLEFSIWFQLLFKKTNTQLAWPTLEETQSVGIDKYFKYLHLFRTAIQPLVGKETYRFIPPILEGLEKNPIQPVVFEGERNWGVKYFFVTGYTKEEAQNTGYKIMQKGSFYNTSVSPYKEGYYSSAKVFLCS